MNKLSPEKRDALKRMIAAGMTNRSIQRALPCSHATVTRYARMWTFSPVCGCGRPAGHKAWCDVRVAFSPQRRGFLATRWGMRKQTTLAQTVDNATVAAKALGHRLGSFMWSSSTAASMAFALCTICGKSVRIFGTGSKWERYQDWEQFAGTAVTERCKTAYQRAAEKAAQQEKRSWREAKRTLGELKRILRDPSHSPNAASTPDRSSRR